MVILTKIVFKRKVDARGEVELQIHIRGASISPRAWPGLHGDVCNDIARCYHQDVVGSGGVERQGATPHQQKQIYIQAAVEKDIDIELPGDVSIFPESCG